MSSSSMCILYRLYKKHLDFEKYLTISCYRDRVSLSLDVQIVNYLYMIKFICMQQINVLYVTLTYVETSIIIY